jgi:hypothetical protein
LGRGSPNLLSGWFHVSGEGHTNFEGQVRHLQHVAIMKLNLPDHPLPVDEGTIFAIEVLQHHATWLNENATMLTAYRFISGPQMTLFPSPDEKFVPIQLQLMARVFSASYQ